MSEVEKVILAGAFTMMFTYLMPWWGIPAMIGFSIIVICIDNYLWDLKNFKARNQMNRHKQNRRT